MFRLLAPNTSAGYFFRVLVYFVYLAIGAYVFLRLERQNEIELCQAAKNISTLYMKGTELWIWKQFNKTKPETDNWDVTLTGNQYQLLIDAITTVSRDTGIKSIRSIFILLHFRCLNGTRVPRKLDISKCLLFCRNCHYYDWLRECCSKDPKRKSMLTIQCRLYIITLVTHQ